MSTTIQGAQAGSAYRGDTTLVVVTCCNCHITYAIPKSLDDEALRNRGPNGKSIRCPLGHSWHYIGKTEAEKLRERLEWTEQQRDTARRQREHAEHERNAERAAKARIKNDRNRIRDRVGAGVCPCCNRTFKQLARHMNAKHPDYREPAE